ncbi:carboxypeptidase-like regulatory domain-containing protein [Aestuariibaculum sp. YM273]|uniref:carboxypeptidase-like regulatory domain-containing protein n=1 Tax=Aestuariibaculum sp. YM273 TaxID=3070659 RepID=UPI0027DBA353|nr:carboxypeptidase-like regulatory domain-containing protein [Aestuariibaculum sp. YM273]WMI64329.1 carboxypeptidase-like regulatory domain-containing protein [Aestuariibaculum sp. YM273]
MPIVQKFIGLSFMLFTFFGFSQAVEISGVVNSLGDVENIHVLNKAEQAFTITNATGEFKIEAKLNDTIQFSSVQYQTKYVVVDHQVMLFKAMRVVLEEHVNELDEVVVGKVLTGDLLSDIGNVDGMAPINFYDVGIPGYTGKKKTQSERRLSQAGDFKPKMILGMLLGGGSFDPLINAITGRTKMLKARVDHEERDRLMRNIKARLASDFFRSNPLEEASRMDFFYYCADAPNFVKRCKNQTDFNILLFLRSKYRDYMQNRTEGND